MGYPLEEAVTDALPEGKRAYFFNPILLWHVHGSCYAVFGSANQALAWQRGATPSDRKYFYLTNKDGERIATIEEPRPGHARAILEALDRPERSTDG